MEQLKKARWCTQRIFLSLYPTKTDKTETTAIHQAMYYHAPYMRNKV